MGVTRRGLFCMTGGWNLDECFRDVSQKRQSFHSYYIVIKDYKA